MNRDGALRVHFHIDRASFKTYEAYIELDDPETGGSLVRDFASTGRMVEARVVTVTLSTEEKLMSILFPKAKCVDWNPSGPEIREPQMGETPFHGFVSQEELFQIHRAAETPRKVCSVMVKLNDARHSSLTRSNMLTGRHRDPLMTCSL